MKNKYPKLIKAKTSGIIVKFTEFKEGYVVNNPTKEYRIGYSKI